MFMLSQKLSKKIDEGLKKGFTYTYKFSNTNIHKFILMLQKGIEDIDGWENVIEALLPTKVSK